jgi:membrane protein required for colicin V production
MNWLDYLLIALVAISTIAGLMRGLLREVIALVTWITAVWLAWRFAGVVEPHLGGLLAYQGVSIWAARAIVFVIVLIIGSAIALIVSRVVRLSLFNPTDRAFGAGFGLLRGFVMLGLFVILCHAVRLQDEPWWRGSILVPYAEHVANVLRSLVGERKMLAGDSVAAAFCMSSRVKVQPCAVSSGWSAPARSISVSMTH